MAGQTWPFRVVLHYQRMRILLASVLIGGLVLAACSGDDDQPGPTSQAGADATSPPSATAQPSQPATVDPPPLGLQEVASGFQRPTFVTNAGDGSGRLFVLEKPGRVRIVKDGALVNAPFLDITSLVRASGNEQGLLGLAFHPEFADNGRFWVAYTALDAKNTVAEYRVTDSGSDRADPGTAKVLIAQPDQYPNHNGGMLAFGPDGYLYISMGDGGSSGDPDGNGQDKSSLLGKLLRVDVDGGDPYGIPDSNPFADDSGAKPEVWAWGLRNPWRFSFDRETGDIWIADVGQNKYEEIDFQPADSRGGENYGWNEMEGEECYRSGCRTEGFVRPVFAYDHGKGCSVTGGYVYRGEAIRGLAGGYLFTDYCSGTLWLTSRNGDRFETEEIGALPDGVSSFGEDEAGELYVVLDQGGSLQRIVAE